MQQSLLVASALALALSGAALAQGTASYPSSPDQIAPLAVSDPQEFTTRAAVAGMFEIQSSQLALTKTQNADIKAFAQQMVSDHTKIAEDLTNAAASQPNIDVPTALDPVSAAKLAELNKATGPEFDKLYVAAQTEGHITAVGLFEGYVKEGSAGPLQDFASATLPTLNTHYEHVLTLPH